MSERGPLRVFLLVLTFVVGIGTSVAAIILTLHTTSAHPGVDPYSYVDDGWLTQLVLVPVTAIMVWRRPDHSITHIYVALTVLAGLQQLSGAYAIEGLVAVGFPHSSGAVAAQFGQGIFQIWVVLTFLLLLALYPTGKTVGRFFAWIPWVIAALYLVAPTFNLLAQPTPFPSEPEFPEPPVIGAIEGPLSDFPAGVRTAGDLVFSLLIGAVLIFVVVQVFVRHRRASGAERQQVRWFFYAVVLAIVLFFVLPLGAGSEGEGLLNPWSVAPALILGSMALAILRYRLYDIDRIASRTITYSFVVGFSGLVFAAGVVWIPSLFDLGDSPLLVAASTLTVAALFNPVRRRLQRLVDRRFNRSRYDAEQVIGRFAGSLRDRVDADQLISGLLGVVTETMQPGEVGVWVRQP